MAPTTRNSVIAAQLSAIATRLDAILASMNDDIVVIKTHMIENGRYCRKADEDRKNTMAEDNSMAEKRDEMKQIQHKGNTGNFPLFTQNVDEPNGVINKQRKKVYQGNLPLFKQYLGEQIKVINKKRNKNFKGNLPFKMYLQKVSHLFFCSELPSGSGGIDPNRTAELFKRILVAIDVVRVEKEHFLAPFSIRSGYLNKSMDRRQRVGLLYRSCDVGSRYIDRTDGIHLTEIDRVLSPSGYFVWIPQIANTRVFVRNKDNSTLGGHECNFAKDFCWDLSSLLAKTTIWEKPNNKYCYTSMSHRSYPNSVVYQHLMVQLQASPLTSQGMNKLTLVGDKEKSTTYAELHHLVLNIGQPSFIRATSSRLEDKSSLPAGCIDTNPSGQKLLGGRRETGWREKFNIPEFPELWEEWGSS